MGVAPMREARHGPKGGRLPRRWEPVRSLAAGVMVVALGAAAYWAFRMAYADRLYHIGTPAAVAGARRLSPGNASYFQNDPRDRRALEYAVAQNVRYSRGWVELGLLAEVNGDLPRAEKCLLAAAAVDRTYQPLWTLANFYFRRADRENFWTWTHRAAGMTNYDLTPLFRLCWRVTEDPAVILARGVPNRPESLAQYLSFLLREDKLDAAEPVAKRLISMGGAESAPLLVSYCDRLITAGRTELAGESWNARCHRNLLPYRALEPRQGRVLTNGDFTAPALQAGFDWRVSLAEGIEAERAGPPPALRISFSGKQPESCDLLSQALPLIPSRAYRLTYSRKTSGLPAAAGLRWCLSDLTSRKELASEPVQISESSWETGVFSFAAPESNRGALLVLQYRRPEGTPRSEGALWLRQVSLSFQ